MLFKIQMLSFTLKYLKKNIHHQNIQKKFWKNPTYHHINVNPCIYAEKICEHILCVLELLRQYQWRGTKTSINNINKQDIYLEEKEFTWRWYMCV